MIVVAEENSTTKSRATGAQASTNASVPTREGNIILSGTDGTVSKGFQIYNTLVKPGGDTLWARPGAFLPTGTQEIKQTADGGYIFAGTAWQGARETVRGRMAITVFSSGSNSIAWRQPPGGSGWRRKASVSPTARN